MPMISSLDLIAACASLAAVVVFCVKPKQFSMGERGIVIAIGLFAFALNMSNFWVWRGQSTGADIAENWADYLEILQPVLWGIFFYIIVQARQKRVLEHNRKQMRDLVEHMPVILQAFDQQGKVLAWNHYAEQVTGYSKQEVIGNSELIKKIFPEPEYRDQLLSECRNGGGHYQHKVRAIRCKQRIERQIAWSNISQQFPIDGWANWGIGLDLTEQIKAQKSLERMATHDELTGLANRALFLDRLERSLTSAQRHQTHGALILIDLDYFKMVNDSHGHPMGDHLLCEVAQRLTGCVKATDTIARFGGDEFILLLEKIDCAEDVSMIAERIKTQVSEKPYMFNGSEVRLRFSMGIAMFPDDDSRVDELLKYVDLALYAAKESGRNHYHFYSRGLHNKLRWQHRVSEKLRQAINESEFSIVYQPQLDLLTHQVVGLEALLRWNAFDEVPLSPSAFVPIAEKMGLMPLLGSWVVEKVCEQSAQWRDQGMHVPIAINMSAMQLYQLNLVDVVSQVVDEYGLDANLIEFEITESSVMRNIDNAISIMRQLTQKGFQLSLDDFGTGYSSLSYLKRFPISKIKIDQSFIRSLETDPVDASIVRSVIDLGHSLNLKVLAEGVETSGQLNHLTKEGCDYLQGFYFSRPLNAESVKGYMQQNALH